MPPPTTTRSTRPSSVRSTPIFSPTLAPPPTTATKGRAGSSSSRRPPQHRDLAFEEAPGRRRQPRRGSHDRGVGAVRGAEGVVDVGVEPGHQARHEVGVAALLAGVEPQVVQERHPGGELGQAGSHGGHVVAGVAPSLGPAQVGGGRDRRPPLGQPSQGGQHGADAEVVGHHGLAPRAVSEGHALQSTRTSTRRPATSGRSFSRGRPARTPGTAVSPAGTEGRRTRSGRGGRGGAHQHGHVHQASWRGPSSLSYQPCTFAMVVVSSTGITMVSPESKMHEAGLPTMSDDTSGSSV